MNSLLKFLSVVDQCLHWWSDWEQSVHQLHWMADTSRKGINASAGLMVNYLYRWSWSLSKIMNGGGFWLICKWNGQEFLRFWHTSSLANLKDSEPACVEYHGCQKINKFGMLSEKWKCTLLLLARYGCHLRSLRYFLLLPASTSVTIVFNCMVKWEVVWFPVILNSVVICMCTRLKDIEINNQAYLNKQSIAASEAVTKYLGQQPAPGSDKGGSSQSSKLWLRCLFPLYHLLYI